MFHFLRGKLAMTAAPVVVLDVQGIGYELQAPFSTFDHLPEFGQELTLFTHVVVREDAEQIFGFLSIRERDFFRALIKVNGIGPKAALSLLSHLPLNSLIEALSFNPGLLTKVPGIGKKTAERLVIEFRDKLEMLRGDDALPMNTNQPQAARREAFSALLALGYKEADAQRVLNKIEEGTQTAQQLIRTALSQLSRGAA